MVGGEEGRRCFQLVRRPPLSGVAEPGAGLVPAVGGAWLERLPQVIDCLCEACLHLPDCSSGTAPGVQALPVPQLRPASVDSRVLRGLLLVTRLKGCYERGF